MGTDYAAGSPEAAVVHSIETFSRCLVDKDFAGWSTYWDENGVLMPPGHPRVIGRDNIEAYVRTHFAGAKSMTLSNWDIDVVGDLAIVTNDATWRAKTGEEGTLKQLMVLRRAGDGRWIRTRVIYNFDEPG